MNAGALRLLYPSHRVTPKLPDPRMGKLSPPSGLPRSEEDVIQRLSALEAKVCEKLRNAGVPATLQEFRELSPGFPHGSTYDKRARAAHIALAFLGEIEKGQSLDILLEALESDLLTSMRGAVLPDQQRPSVLPNVWGVEHVSPLSRYMRTKGEAETEVTIVDSVDDLRIIVSYKGRSINPPERDQHWTLKDHEVRGISQDESDLGELFWSTFPEDEEMHLWLLLEGRTARRALDMRDQKQVEAILEEMVQRFANDPRHRDFPAELVKMCQRKIIHLQPVLNHLANVVHHSTVLRDLIARGQAASAALQMIALKDELATVELGFGTYQEDVQVRYKNHLKEKRTEAEVKASAAEQKVDKFKPHHAGGGRRRREMKEEAQGAYRADAAAYVARNPYCSRPELARYLRDLAEARNAELEPRDREKIPALNTLIAWTRDLVGPTKRSQKAARK